MEAASWEVIQQGTSCRHPLRVRIVWSFSAALLSPARNFTALFLMYEDSLQYGVGNSAPYHNTILCDSNNAQSAVFCTYLQYLSNNIVARAELLVKLVSVFTLKNLSLDTQLAKNQFQQSNNLSWYIVCYYLKLF